MLDETEIIVIVVVDVNPPYIELKPNVSLLEMPQSTHVKSTLQCRM